MQLTKRGICRACERDDVTFSAFNQVCNRCRNNNNEVVLPKWERTKKVLKKVGGFTYGEAHTIVKMSLEMVAGNWECLPRPEHKPRMSKQEADIYYTKKLNQEFTRLGYVRKTKAQYVPEPVKVLKAIKEVCENIDGFKEQVHLSFMSVRKQTGLMLKNEISKAKLELGVVA